MLCGCRLSGSPFSVISSAPLSYPQHGCRHLAVKTSCTGTGRPGAYFPHHFLCPQCDLVGLLGRPVNGRRQFQPMGTRTGRYVGFANAAAESAAITDAVPFLAGCPHPAQLSSMPLPARIPADCRKRLPDITYPVAVRAGHIPAPKLNLF